MEGDGFSFFFVFKVFSLSRVISSLFDFRKYWYVFIKEFCRGFLKDFVRNEIFKLFLVSFRGNFSSKNRRILAILKEIRYMSF